MNLFYLFIWNVYVLYEQMYINMVLISQQICTLNLFKLSFKFIFLAMTRTLWTGESMPTYDDVIGF